MNLYQVVANDVAALQVEQGADCPQITWNNTQWSVLPGSVMQNQPLRAGGFSSVFDFSCLIVVQQFVAANLPGISDGATLSAVLLNDPIIYLGQGYKVVNAHILSGATLLKLECNSINQNA